MALEFGLFRRGTLSRGIGIQTDAADAEGIYEAVTRPTMRSSRSRSRNSRRR